MRNGAISLWRAAQTPTTRLIISDARMNQAYAPRGDEPQRTGVSAMTQIFSIGPRQFGEAPSSGVAAAARGLFSKLCEPDVLVVLALCAVGLTVTLIAAFWLPDFSHAVAEANLVGP
jgi:hypothetical protein